jgi:hypothetical protein
VVRRNLLEVTALKVSFLFEEFDPVIGSQSTTIEDEDDTGKEEDEDEVD